MFAVSDDAVILLGGDGDEVFPKGRKFACVSRKMGARPVLGHLRVYNFLIIYTLRLSRKFSLTLTLTNSLAAPTVRRHVLGVAVDESSLRAEDKENKLDTNDIFSADPQK